VNKFNRTHDPGTHLVGRAREVARIERQLVAAEQNHPCVLQITGEAGIGKTRVLAVTLDRASDAGYVVVSGRATEFDTDEPYGVFLDALDHAFAELAHEALAALAEEQRAELAAVFPALAARMAADGIVASPDGVGGDRYRLHRAVSALLDALGDGMPVLLAVDDLHWADPASTELLLYLLRRPPSANLLVAVTFRTRQLKPATAAVLQQVQRDCGGDLIELAPLTAEEAGLLLPPQLSSASAERIYRDSGGNPFYLKELVRALEDDPSTPALGGGDAEHVPATITAVIATEVERLSPRARELVRAAAVLGEVFEPELAREVIEMDAAEYIAALDELVDRELVQDARTPALFRFRHPIVRQAVYESAKGGWRREAHARAAAVLADRGASASARARHLERSASLGDAEAIAVLTEAGHTAAARAPAAAAEWFRAALRLLPANEREDLRLELTLAMAVALGSAGQLTESRAAFQEVLALLDDPVLRGSAVAAAALIEHLLGKHDEAQGLLLSALAGLDDDAPGATELKLGIALGCFFSADWSGMRYWGHEVSRAKQTSPILEAGASAALALAEYGLGNITKAAALASRGAAVADGLSDADWAPQLLSICFLGWVEYCVGRYDAAERHMSRALAVSRETGQGHLAGAMLVVQAMSNLAVGKPRVAEELADTAIDTTLLSANNLFLTWAMTVRCMVEIECGSPTAAVRFGQKALQAGIQSRSPWSSVAILYLAAAWLEAGEPERFRQQLFAGQSMPRLPPLLFYSVYAYELLTRAELESHRTDAARRWADEAVAVSQQLGLDGPMAEAQRAQAMLALDAGSFATAAQMARTSAVHGERAGEPTQAGRSHLLAGIALGRAGEVEGAIEELRRAEELLAAHGASRYRDQALRELRQLGVHVGQPREPTPPGADLGALSKRELAIAALVHEGRTNRQIADELSISAKTVENHLARIFRRLEISSRSQLATLVERSRGVAA
jgi:ATP/maltotriose-dependent transcriptional regulator MalT